MQHYLKSKTIIIVAFGLDEFMCVSHSEIAKEMWDTVYVTHEGIFEVNRQRLNTLTYKYKLFKMKHEVTIYDKQKDIYSYRESHENFGGNFQNEEFIVKFLICLNCSWKPKGTAICKSKNLSFMELATLFIKVREHEMELERLECDKKKRKNNAQKVTNTLDMKLGNEYNESNEDM